MAHQAHLSMGFPRQGYWGGLPFPSSGDLPDPGIKPRSPAVQADSLPSEPPRKLFYLFINFFVCRDHLILYQCILSGIWDSETFQGMLDTRFLESALSNNSLIHRLLTLKVTASQIHQGNKLESTGGNKRACKK